MPDHLHGIVRIHAERRDAPLGRLKEEGTKTFLSSETPPRGVSTKANQRWSAASLGAIINQFKMSCTKRIRSSGYQDFFWQSRYHDHIILSNDELSAVKKYITFNPDRWDKENIPWHADAASWSL